MGTQNINCWHGDRADSEPSFVLGSETTIDTSSPVQLSGTLQGRETVWLESAHKSLTPYPSGSVRFSSRDASNIIGDSTPMFNPALQTLTETPLCMAAHSVGSTRPRVLLADCHAVMLVGITAALQKHYDIAGAVGDGRALVAAALANPPDAIVLDIEMPLLNGIDAACLIKGRLPAVKLLFFTLHAGRAFMAAGMRAGASGYLLKTATSDELLRALREILDGKIHISAEVAAPAVERPDARPPAAGHFELTERECEVLQLIAEGHATKEIAHLLMITARTVTFHRERIKQKLGLFTTAELTKYALGRGLLV